MRRTVLPDDMKSDIHHVCCLEDKTSNELRTTDVTGQGYLCSWQWVKTFLAPSAMTLAVNTSLPCKLQKAPKHT